MINIGICDDESFEMDRANSLLEKYSREHPLYQINIKLFSSPLNLLAHVEEYKGFDILILDVYMPGILGTKTAQELRDMGDDCEIIFLTTSRDHAVEAFAVNAAHYLVKPYNENEFFKALDKAFENLTKKEGAYITIKTTDGVIRVNLNKLVYSESENHFQCLHLAEGKMVYTRKSSAELFELLEEDSRFYKCGNTFIINLDYIAELSSKSFIFSTGDSIPMLSRKYTEFRKKYMDYVCSH